MTNTLTRPRSALARAGVVLGLCLGGRAAVVGADDGRAPAAGAAIPDASARLPVGASIRVDGVRDRVFVAENATTVRALPGAAFAIVTNSADALVIRLDAGTLAEAGGPVGRVEIRTDAYAVRADRALVCVRDLPGGVYVEHIAGSTGTVALVRTSGRGAPTPDAAEVSLAAGTFRMTTPNELALSTTSATRAAVVVPRVVSTSYPGARDPSASGDGTASAVAPPPVAVPGAAAPDDSPGRPVVPAPGPCILNLPYIPNPPAAPPVVYVPRAPAPCSPLPVCTVGCGEMVTTSGVPVADRADEAGRVPLGSALGARGPCDSCAGTECNRIPYVHYVEGLVCDVTTYKVGCCLVTVRPASRVRAHRLPDGSLELWAPNLGKDLALIELNENQFGFIGEDGYLVVGADCQIDYFRGLVHLYPRRDATLNLDRPQTRRDIPVSNFGLPNPVPARRDAGGSGSSH